MASLIEANPHLRDPLARERAIVNFVYGSNRLAGLRVTKAQTRANYRHVVANMKPKSRSRIFRNL